jgi:hypothetical protein
MTTAHENAVEFGRLERQGGWALGILVACSVEPESHGGDRRSSDRSSNDRKLNAQAFARQAQSSTPRILRYFEAWERAADAGVVSHAATLSPGDAHDERWAPLEAEYAWFKTRDGDGFYEAVSGGRPRDSKAEDAATIIERRGAAAAVAAMPPMLRNELSRELRKAEEAEGAAEAARTPITRDGTAARAEHATARALDLDVATIHLRSAARELYEAEMARRGFGIEDAAAEREALARVRSLLHAYGRDETWTDEDESFLSELGVRT